MAKVLSTCGLVNTTLRRAMIPKDQSTFTTCDIIDIMNEELGIHVVPMVLRAHEEYYVIDEDQPLTNCDTRYKIPYRAVGNKLRDVQFVDSSGSSFEMTRVSLEDRPEYQSSYSTSQSRAFYLQSDDIVLMQKQNSTGSIRSSYYLRPNELVKDNRAGIITSICVGACETIFTVAKFPSHFSSTTDFDFIQGKSPNKIIGFDRAVGVLNSAAKTLTFSNSDLNAIDTAGSVDVKLKFAVGDHILKAQETIIPQLPAELQPILSQRTAVKILEALGDTEGMRNAQTELDRMEYNAMTLIDNRVEGAPQKVRSRHSTLKNSLSNGLYRRR